MIKITSGKNIITLPVQLEPGQTITFTNTGKEAAPITGHNNGSLTNTAALCFILGWQGGTVHQVAEVLGVTREDILIANNTRMGELARLAQKIGFV